MRMHHDGVRRERRPALVGDPSIAELTVFPGGTGKSRIEASDGVKTIGPQRHVVRCKQPSAPIPAVEVIRQVGDQLLARRGERVVNQRIQRAPTNEITWRSIERASQTCKPLTLGDAIIIDKREVCESGVPGAVISSRRRPGIRLANQFRVELISPPGEHGLRTFGASIVNNDDLESILRIVEARESLEARIQLGVAPVRRNDD